MKNKIAVIGAGAIGSLIAAYIAKAGHHVSIIDIWPQHVETIKTQGLTLNADNDEFTVPIDAFHLGELSNSNPKFDFVFCCVKSQDTVWVIKFIERYMSPAGVIISAQNGINDEIIASLVGFSKTIGCVITLGAMLIEPGIVKRTSAKENPALTLGELNGLISSRLNFLKDILELVGPIALTNNLWGQRWAKLAQNCMSNSLAGVTGLGSRELRTRHDTLRILVEIATEVVNVAKVLGISIEAINGVESKLFSSNSTVNKDIIMKSLKKDAYKLGEGKPSLLQDIEKKRLTEVDFLNGYIVKKGKEVGVKTPLNERLVELVHEIEKGNKIQDINYAVELLTKK